MSLPNLIASCGSLFCVTSLEVPPCCSLCEAALALAPAPCLVFPPCSFYHLPSGPRSHLFTLGSPKARHCRSCPHGLPAAPRDEVSRGPPLGGGLPQPTIGAEGDQPLSGFQISSVSWSLSVGSPVTDPGSLSPVQLSADPGDFVTSHALCARGCGLLDSCGSCLTASLDIPVGEPWQASPQVVLVCPQAGASPSPTLHPPTLWRVQP